MSNASFVNLYHWYPSDTAYMNRFQEEEIILTLNHNGKEIQFDVKEHIEKFWGSKDFMHDPIIGSIKEKLKGEEFSLTEEKKLNINPFVEKLAQLKMLIK